MARGSTLTRRFRPPTRTGAPSRSRAWLGLVTVALGAAVLAGCVPPKPAATPPATTPPTTAPPPPALPAALGGASASPMVIGGKAEDFPDPFVLRIDDAAQCGTDPAPCYYAYSTEAGFLGLLNVPVARSTDLTTWNWAGGTAVVPTPPATPPPPTKDAMPVLASWVQFGGNWAPSVVARPSNPADQRYVMYYTGRSQTSSPFGGKECVGVATSAKPDGPFVDTASAPLLCQPSLGGTIDPSPFVASDGSLYLDYSNDTGIYARPLNFIGLTFSGGESRLLGLSDGFSWDKVHIEGPSMMSTPATGTLLFYSAGDFGFATYSVGAARCNGPLGPCGRVYSTAVLSSRGSMLGTGGQTPFQLADGSWRVGFHAWDGTVGYPAGGKRSLHFLPLTFPSNNPKIG